MSIKHLTRGEALPPKVDGKLRLYGMLFCPYVLRVRLVLIVKKIPHDIVYVDLQNKPEWLFKMNPKGQVPILDDGTNILTESLNICYYLEEKYPEPALMREDKMQRSQDLELIEKIEEGVSLFYKSLVAVEDKKLSEILKDAEPLFSYFDEEIKKIGNVPKAGLVDYMAWPWVEKLPMFNIISQDDADFPRKFLNLLSWRRNMLEDEAIKCTLLDIKQHYNYLHFVKNTRQKSVNEI